MEAVLALLDDRSARSGAELGHELGISRAAVWKQIHALKAAGVPVLSEPRRGYRLSWPLDLLSADTIRDSLRRSGIVKLPTIEVLDRVDSTSDALWRRHQGGDSRSCVLLAEQQTGGRGRRQRSWSSPYGAQICLSMLWRLEGGVAAAQGLSIALGVAAWRALREIGVDTVMLKWPNDLQVDDHKLGGVLIEASGELGGPCTVVAGIGINVRLPPEFSVDQAFTDLHRACGTAPERNLLAAVLCRHWLQMLDSYPQHGLAGVLDDFRHADALHQRPVRVESGNDFADGVAQGIDGQGRLRVLQDNRERCFASAEVSVRAQ